MRWLLVGSLLALACCGPAQEPRLYGAWQSNRDLTLAEFRKIPGITSERLEVLSAPDLFGHMVTIYRPHDAIVVFDGECAVTPYAITDSSSDYVDIKFYDSLEEKTVTRRIFLGSGMIWMPVGGAREIFTRVEIERLEAEHACLRPLLAS